jgi:hypothetical protein
MERLETHFKLLEVYTGIIQKSRVLQNPLLHLLIVLLDEYFKSGMKKDDNALLSVLYWLLRSNERAYKLPINLSTFVL